MAHGLSCFTACGIFPDQGSKLCPLHWHCLSFFIALFKEQMFLSLNFIHFLLVHFLSCLRNLGLPQVCEDILCFLLEGFIVLAPAFRSLVDLKLIFGYGMRSGLEFMFSQHDNLVALCHIEEVPFYFLLAEC